jgi:hypothetical protein
MRRFCCVISMVCVVSGPALAYENFIPLGTGYSTDVTEVPGFDTERGQVNQQADIIETEIYRAEQDKAAAESSLRRFFSDSEVSGSDTSIDY